uniref:Uncharacterized protein n=1 Tax=Timspurckia oligopyrenoides TaxID=708627 RepID=A0A7S0ZH26_9RHOD
MVGFVNCVNLQGTPQLCASSSVQMCASSDTTAVSRRSLLSSVGASLAAVLIVGSSIESASAKGGKGTKGDPKVDLSLDDLRKDLETTKYEETLLQNPDPKEKLLVNVKPPEVEPAYKEVERKELELEKKRYSKMLEQEAAETTALLKKFKK